MEVASCCAYLNPCTDFNACESFWEIDSTCHKVGVVAASALAGLVVPFFGGIAMFRYLSGARPIGNVSEHVRALMSPVSEEAAIDVRCEACAPPFEIWEKEFFGKNPRRQFLYDQLSEELARDGLQAGKADHGNCLPDAVAQVLRLMGRGDTMRSVRADMAEYAATNSWVEEQFMRDKESNPDYEVIHDFNEYCDLLRRTAEEDSTLWCGPLELKMLADIFTARIIVHEPRISPVNDINQLSPDGPYHGCPRKKFGANYVAYIAGGQTLYTPQGGEQITMIIRLALLSDAPWGHYDPVVKNSGT